MDANDKYRDIINLPHHVSETHAQMSMRSRAAQFLPFAALRGFDEALSEIARHTVEKKELAEDARDELDAALRRALSGGGEVALTYFVPDARKPGGEYVTVRGRVKRVDTLVGALLLDSGEWIALEDILSVEAIQEENQ